MLPSVAAAATVANREPPGCTWASCLMRLSVAGTATVDCSRRRDAVRTTSTHLSSMDLVEHKECGTALVQIGMPGASGLALSCGPLLAPVWDKGPRYFAPKSSKRLWAN